MDKEKNEIAINTYNKIAKDYFKEFGDDYSDVPYVDKFLDQLLGKKVLDIGCGVGNLTNYINQKGYHVTGIDYASEMLEIAKKEFKNTEFIKMDMRNITLKDKYDGIMLAYSLFHVTKKDAEYVLNKCYELLNPKGKMLIILQEGNKEEIINEPLNSSLKMFVSYYTEEEITKKLENNFKILYKDHKIPTNEFELGNNKIILICEKI